MKKIFTIAAAVLLTASVFAQAPEKMSYQAVVRDAGNALLTSTAIGMEISVLQGSPTGNAVYVETQTSSTNANGLVSLEIGTGTPVTGTFSGINWATGPYFIKTETDPTGGTAYTIAGTRELMSVPYALFSANGATGTAVGVGPFYLGQDTLGGIVYYIYIGSDIQQHGLIVNKNETDAMWQSTSILADADRTEDGAWNTGLITSSPAVTYATSFGAGWYLPSIDELGLLYYNRFSTNKALRAGGFNTLSKTAIYWSSTENAIANAQCFRFDYGHATNSYKVTNQKVRAVRAF